MQITIPFINVTRTQGPFSPKTKLDRLRSVTVEAENEADAVEYVESLLQAWNVEFERVPNPLA